MLRTLPRAYCKRIQMRWDQGREQNTRKQDPQGSSLRWSLGTAFRPLAAAQGIPVLEPVVVGNSSIDVDCCSDGHDDQKDRHTCTSLTSGFLILNFILLLLYGNCIRPALNPHCEHEKPIWSTKFRRLNKSSSSPLVILTVFQKLHLLLNSLLNF